MLNPRRFGMLVATIGAALVAVALFATTALATTPAKGYEAFAGCPSPEENPEVLICQRAVIDGGHFQMGSKDVPITKPITLSAGVMANRLLVANKNGGMSLAKQKVPGGVIGLTGLTWLAEFLGSEALTLYAVTELAGQPFLGTEHQTEIVLPIRVHLENPVLGKSCYVGTFANPITLKLTTETTNPPPPNKPITGTQASFEADPTREGVGLLKDNVFVDNAFAAPGASGCVLTLFGFIPISINGLVNAQSGLPSPAGTNETKQNTDIELVSVGFVYP